MNDPGPEALADPTLIMLREPHLGGTGGRLANSGTAAPESACGPPAARSKQLQSWVTVAPWEKGAFYSDSTEDITAGSDFQSTILWKGQMDVINSGHFPLIGH